jgi:hypothetical protein
VKKTFNRPRKQAPKTLEAEARGWWYRILGEFAIQDQAGFLLLQTALEAFQAMRQAQTLLTAEGLVTRDRWGAGKAASGHGTRAGFQVADVASS